VKLEYDELNPFSLCCVTYTPIYRGKPEEKCPLCQASYKPEYKGTICKICRVRLTYSDINYIDALSVEMKYL